jgi:hypothetical protein
MWWMPEWLERRLPRLHIEAEERPETGDEQRVPPGQEPASVTS